MKGSLLFLRRVVSSPVIQSDRPTERDAHQRVPEGGRERPLDTRTKSASAPLHHDQDGVILEQHDPTLKWQMQAMARLAVGVYDLNSEYKDGHRIRICCRHPLFNEETKKDSPVQVRQSEKSKRAYYAGLMKCASVWVCPVCAPKIQAVRALEVRTAIDNWTAQGGSVVLVTQTIPHGRRDLLQPLLERFTTALRKFKGQRGYERARDKFRITGSIRALEVTYGANGWHPHAHTILFLQTSPPTPAPSHGALSALGVCGSSCRI